jgi:hypothetical protein
MKELEYWEITPDVVSDCCYNRWVDMTCKRGYALFSHFRWFRSILPKTLCYLILFCFMSIIRLFLSAFYENDLFPFLKTSLISARVIVKHVFYNVVFVDFEHLTKPEVNKCNIKWFIINEAKCQCSLRYK